MPWNAKTTAQRQALPKPEILAIPLETNIIESAVLAAEAVSADSSGPYQGRRYLLAGTVLAKRDDGKYIPYEQGAGEFDEVQKVTVVDATGGTFKLRFEGQTTATIAFNASTATVKAALEALSNIGENEVAVTGSPGNYTITFAGTLAEENVGEIEVVEDEVTPAAASVEAETVTEGAQQIAGVLFETVEFADNTTASDEAAAFLRRNVSFDQNRIVNFEELEDDLLTWGSKTNCEFIDVTNAQEA